LAKVRVADAEFDRDRRQTETLLTTKSTEESDRETIQNGGRRDALPEDTSHEELLAQSRLKLRCSPRHCLAIVAADKRNCRASVREGISTYTDAPRLVHGAQEASLAHTAVARFSALAAQE
jgi:hypothetical protein